MTSDIKKQVEDLQQEFRKYTLNVENEVDKAILKSALKVEGDAKRSLRSSDEPSVPGEAPRNQTGRLRASITHRLGEESGNTYAEVGTNVDYGFWQEFGTSKMPAHPFLTPAFESNKQAIQEYIAKAVKKAEENAGR